MYRCTHTVTCPFFSAAVGYSPGLFEAMRDRYCLGDNSDCARFLAIEAVGRDRVPDELLPSDVDALERLMQEDGD